MLIDKFGRQITYVRLSVTDRCNLRCFYCMPNEGLDFLPRNELLTYEELLRLARLLCCEGVTKFRITGGEPFVRKDLIGFIKHLKEIESNPDVHITSNGVLLEPFIPALKEIKIDSINLSLDTLNRDRFYQITHRDYFEKVWKSFQKLQDSDIATKVNIVVMKGKNEQDILPMAKLAVTYPVQIRFIEEMPFNGSGEVHEMISYNQIREILVNEFNDLISINSEIGSTSMNFTSESLKGSLGIIPAYSRTFCGSCNRIRITSQGILKNCLYDDHGLDLKALLRSGASDSKIISDIQNWITNKKIDGFEAENNRKNVEFESMSIIGG